MNMATFFKTERKEKEMSSVPKMKCDICSRKIVVGYEFKCGCGKTLCIACRMPEEHTCTVQVKKVKLDKVVADKLKDKL